MKDKSQLTEFNLVVHSRHIRLHLPSDDKAGQERFARQCDSIGYAVEKKRAVDHATSGNCFVNVRGWAVKSEQAAD